MSTSNPVVGSPSCAGPPIPRMDICPAAPPETPYPNIPREAEKKPGTIWFSTGSMEV